MKHLLFIAAILASPVALAEHPVKELVTLSNEMDDVKIGICNRLINDAPELVPDSDDCDHTAEVGAKYITILVNSLLIEGVDIGAAGSIKLAGIAYDNLTFSEMVQIGSAVFELGNPAFFMASHYPDMISDRVGLDTYSKLKLWSML